MEGLLRSPIVSLWDEGSRRHSAQRWRERLWRDRSVQHSNDNAAMTVTHARTLHLLEATRVVGGVCLRASRSE
jgi:hypothetical protein